MKAVALSDADISTAASPGTFAASCLNIETARGDGTSCCNGPGPWPFFSLLCFLGPPLLPPPPLAWPSNKENAQWRNGIMKQQHHQIDLPVRERKRVTLKQHARDETTRHDTGASMWHVRLFLVHAGRWGGRGEGANPPKKERKINKRRVKREESDTNTR